MGATLPIATTLGTTRMSGYLSTQMADAFLKDIIYTISYPELYKIISGVINADCYGGRICQAKQIY